MLETMTQKALCDFIPGKAARITTLLRRGRKMALKQALLTFYRSEAYRLLEREETKLWHKSPAQIYAEYLKTCPSRRMELSERSASQQTGSVCRADSGVASQGADASGNGGRTQALRLFDHRAKSFAVSAEEERYPMTCPTVQPLLLERVAEV